MNSFGASPSGSLTQNNSSGFYKEKTPRGYSKGKTQNFTPEQISLFQQLFGNLNPDSFTNKLAQGDQGTFDQLEAPALQQFNALQGNIASRFSGMGSGARRSSGFQNTMDQASSDFAQQLQSQRMGLQRNALSDLFNMGNVLLGQRPMETSFTEKPKSFLHSLGTSFAGGAGAGIAKYFTGGM